MAGLPAIDRLLDLLRTAIQDGTLVKLTLGGPCGADKTLRSVFVRPVLLRVGPCLSFLFRHLTRDITQNLPAEEAVRRVELLLEASFRHAHLFTTTQSAQLELRQGHAPRLRLGPSRHAAPAQTGHDHAKARAIQPQSSPWLQALGVTTPQGAVCDSMAAKYRQINKFAEILSHWVAQLPPAGDRGRRLLDMGCGKGYLTFTAYDLLVRQSSVPPQVLGIEARPDLVSLCNRVAQACGCQGLRFQQNRIVEADTTAVDILLALHACDTATDDALAQGIKGGANLILVAPCCHKELRPQLQPPPALADALRHGILRERQAEFVTDALRAALLEWAGYDTKVFEFIASEHTAKNLMIAAVKRTGQQTRQGPDRQVRALAAFYGIRSQRLAKALGFQLVL